MIEVEKKFLLKEQDKNRLVQDAEFISERTFIDRYYDTEDYSLTCRDIWLRSRDGKFELKLPLIKEAMGQRITDQYEELEDDEKLRNALNLPAGGTFSEVLEQNHYVPFATITTTRKKYKKADFIIDLDEMDFGYAIGEIELMVNNKSEIEEAVKKITDFAKQQGLVLAPVRGKVVEYIKRSQTDHYQALLKSGVVKEF